MHHEVETLLRRYFLSWRQLPCFELLLLTTSTSRVVGFHWAWQFILCSCPRSLFPCCAVVTVFFWLARPGVLLLGASCKAWLLHSRLIALVKLSPNFLQARAAQLRCTYMDKQGWADSHMLFVHCHILAGTFSLWKSVQLLQLHSRQSSGETNQSHFEIVMH